MKRPSRFKTFYKSVRTEMRENKLSFITYTVLRLLVIFSMVRQLMNGNYENVFLCISTLFLLLVPSVAQATFRVDFPTPLEISMLVFIFAAEILGELDAFYIKVPYWDTLLHTANGFLCAAAGFSMIDILNRSKKFHMNLSPLFVAIVAFCVSMTVGVLWEFFEFGTDTLLGFDMQKDTVVQNISSTYLDETRSNTAIRINSISDVVINGKNLNVGGYLDIGLIDTMEDLFVNFIGAAVFSVIGYFYIKHRKPKSIITGFVPIIKENGKDGFDK